MEYPWYEIIEDSDEITQGDIIKNCPVSFIKNLENIQEGDNIAAELEEIDGVILTQACDIAQNKVDNIILCSITSREDFNSQQIEEKGPNANTYNVLQEMKKGRLPGYHLLNKYDSSNFTSDYYIVNFKDIYSVPLETIKEVAKINGKRQRLCPPYREHLSQAFARYFMRVGLPNDIIIDKK